MKARIEEYALIGDCTTAALVSREGSIDWLCWPRFDSPACFAALLGSSKNGHWKVAASSRGRITRRYRAGTLILETTFETEEGSATIIDFMPAPAEHSAIMRLVEGKRGRVEMEMELAVRFDYGQAVPWVTRLEKGGIRAIAGSNMTVLRTTTEVRRDELETKATFTVSKGQTIPFVLSYGESFRSAPRAIAVRDALSRTEKFWKGWTSQCSYRGRYGKTLKRSMIILKALTYKPTGGMVAAPTTSLPEKLGGERNWDYRFCWLRDSTFTLLAFLGGGYFKEAHDWQEWLRRAIAGSANQIQIMYGVAGERQLLERTIPWLAGFAASKPVRVGNAAFKQRQLDIFGEIADALHHSHKAGLTLDESWLDLQRGLLAHLTKVWREPGAGMWEIRGQRKHFTYSKVMAWVAFDRAIRGCQEIGFRGPIDQWRSTRQEISDDVCKHGFDESLGSFVQSYGSQKLDASLLRIALVGFLPASDRRVQGTVRAVERHLMHKGFVRRYDTDAGDDGMPPGEGAFLPCSFWLADNYILMGRRREARKLLHRLLSVANDLELLSEEYDPDRKRLLGNFPQAFSHVALINTILNLSRGTRTAELRTVRKE